MYKIKTCRCDYTKEKHVHINMNYMQTSYDMHSNETGARTKFFGPDIENCFLSAQFGRKLKDQLGN